METKLYNNVFYYFIFLLTMCILGFYKTYLIHFPSFEGFKSAHHFHGFIALTWIIMLISQAYLIRQKKYSLHRIIGKASYIVMPLFIISLFYVTKTTYYKVLNSQNAVEANAVISNGLPDMIYMTLLYVLAMVYRKNTAFHLRFMTATGLAMLGPGLGRFLIVACGLSVPVAILTMTLLLLGIGTVWMIIDIKNKKSAFPMLVYIGTCIFSILCNAGNHSDLWQSIASGFAKYFL